MVAITVERSETVPYAKPLPVTEAPPVAEIFAFRVMVEVETELGAEVVKVGTTTAAVGVTAFEADEGELVPTAFTAYTPKV